MYLHRNKERKKQHSEYFMVRKWDKNTLLWSELPSYTSLLKMPTVCEVQQSLPALSASSGPLWWLSVSNADTPSCFKTDENAFSTNQTPSACCLALGSRRGVLTF